MPFDATPTAKPFRLVSARDLLAERMAEIDRQAARAGIKRNWLPNTFEGLADSMGAELQHRLRSEER